jgi:hypothetical protein
LADRINRSDGQYTVTLEGILYPTILTLRYHMSFRQMIGTALWAAAALVTVGCCATSPFIPPTNTNPQSATAARPEVRRKCVPWSGWADHPELCGLDYDGSGNLVCAHTWAFRKVNRECLETPEVYETCMRKGLGLPADHPIFASGGGDCLEQ